MPGPPVDGAAAALQARCSGAPHAPVEPRQATHRHVARPGQCREVWRAASASSAACPSPPLVCNGMWQKSCGCNCPCASTRRAWRGEFFPRLVVLCPARRVLPDVGCSSWHTRVPGFAGRVVAPSQAGGNACTADAVEPGASGLSAARRASSPLPPSSHYSVWAVAGGTTQASVRYGIIRHDQISPGPHPLLPLLLSSHSASRLQPASAHANVR